MCDFAAEHGLSVLLSEPRAGIDTCSLPLLGVVTVFDICVPAATHKQETHAERGADDLVQIHKGILSRR
ncbi:MAG TPA: hypothetical protein VND22_07255 [Actinomycetota bacterium]|nr:hypothetical protein [Actinomycetota bacterium]